MTSTTIFYVFVGIYLVRLICKLLLNVFNVRHAKKQRASVPDEYKSLISPEEAQKHLNYLLARTFFQQFFLVVTTVAFLLFVSSESIGSLARWSQYLDDRMGYEVFLLFYPIMVLFFLCYFPFSWYWIFCLETKFGFNTMSVKQYCSDWGKRILLTLVFLPFGSDV